MKTIELKTGNPITDIRKQIKASRKLIDVSTGEELPVERRKNKRK